mgnify:CR=1 FL=1
MFFFFFPLFYLLFFIWLSRGNSKSIKYSSKELPLVSIIIAARNEQKDINQCIDSLIKQSYPKERMEIIIANDKSVDKTREILDLIKTKVSFIKVINIDKTPVGWSSKKWALNLAINKSKYDIILQTDADCIVDSKWVEKMSIQFNNPEVGFVAGHTPFIQDSDYIINKMLAFENFSQDAFIGLCINNNIPLSCVGRSIGFRKKYFFDSNGYDDFKNEISGDDDLLMHRIVYQKKAKVQYVNMKNSFVYTKSPQNLMQFINQRLRYASKGKLYFNAFFISSQLKIILPFLFINNLLYIVSLLLLCSTPKMIYLFPIIFKMIGDFIIIISFSNITKTSFSFHLFLLSSFMHPFYVIVFSLLGPFINFYWKKN